MQNVGKSPRSWGKLHTHCGILLNQKKDEILFFATEQMFKLHEITQSQNTNISYVAVNIKFKKKNGQYNGSMAKVSRYMLQDPL